MAGGVGGRQGLCVAVTDAVTAPSLVADETCQADMWLEQLCALSHHFTKAKKWHGIKIGPDISFSAGIVFYFFLMVTDAFFGALFDLFFPKQTLGEFSGTGTLSR